MCFNFGDVVFAYMPVSETRTRENSHETQASVSAGGVMSFAIDSGGYLWAWGNNQDGSLGDGTTTRRYTPLRIMSDVIAVSAGGSHAMAITADGGLWAWGNDGATRSRLEPVRVMDETIAVAVGYFNTLSITTDGVLWTWISPDVGIPKAPVKVMDDVVYVSAGIRHMLAIRADGSLWSWGGNWDGQLGDGTTTNRHTPVKIMENVVAVSANSFVLMIHDTTAHTLAVQTDGSLWAWGRNRFGQLGDGTTEDRHYPVRIMDGILTP